MLTAAATFAFADGTKLELLPGVPVLDSARGELGVVGDQSLFVTLADAQIGLAPRTRSLGWPAISIPG